MARDNKIRLPGSGGGLTRFEESASKLEFSPGLVIVLCLLVVAVVVLLNYFGGPLVG